MKWCWQSGWAQNEGWATWFAWYPVRINGWSEKTKGFPKRWAWLERVLRKRMVGADGRLAWEHRHFLKAWRDIVF